MQLFDKLLMCHWFTQSFLNLQRWISIIDFVSSKVTGTVLLAIIDLDRINYFVFSGFLFCVQLMRVDSLMFVLNILIYRFKRFWCFKISKIDICNPFGLQRYLVVMRDVTSQDIGWNRLLETLDSWFSALFTTVRGITPIRWSHTLHSSILSKRFLSILLMYVQIFVIRRWILKIHFRCKLWKFENFKLRILDKLFVHIR